MKEIGGSGLCAAGVSNVKEIPSINICFREAAPKRIVARQEAAKGRFRRKVGRCVVCYYLWYVLFTSKKNYI